ncbi:alpha/beta hydrolase family protein [Gregarina niphandrodes]|uniref:Alpha/beta hydrolase family protein n=1 Tax=Gregarina niphandrodes TaxID=110365 RepID=A0A023B739_GRENI|nr:alpha/beta hydrolase family protein [Gregarina niphandrodes]EZG66963.1 alpha/beta hydrolase family protein [Gregarina niphandrodes]|eukprot:XP_011130400.1 alpha/beta hydrolase family protein [Gregarina niphandrodes]
MAHRNIRSFQTLVKHSPINTLAFDFHCNGQSTGAKEDWSLGGYQREAYDDLEGVVRWIESRGGRVLIILGHSRGASVVLMHSMEFDHVPYVLSLAARFDPSTGLDPYFKPGDRERLLNGEVHVVECQKQFSDGIPRFISAKCLKQRLAIDMSKLRDLTHTKAIFFVHGASDETIPPSHALLLAATLAGKETPGLTDGDLSDSVLAQSDLTEVTNPAGVKGFVKIVGDANHSLKSPHGKKGFEPLLELMSVIYDQIRMIENCSMCLHTAPHMP